MSDRIVVMSEGRIEQVGAPFEIYNYPRTRFTASFVGTLSILNARVTDAAGGAAEIDGQPLRAAKGFAGAAAGAMRAVALRPEAVALGPGPEGRNRMSGVIEEVSFLGSVVRVRVRFKEQAVSFDTFNNPARPPPARGESVAVNFAPEEVLVLDDAPAG